MRGYHPLGQTTPDPAEVERAKESIIGTLATVGGAVVLYVYGVDAKTLSFVGASLVAATVMRSVWKKE